MKTHVILAWITLLSMPAVAGPPAHLVKDIRPGFAGSDPVRMTDASGTLVFGLDGGGAYTPLWTSDGTAAGTVEMVPYVRMVGSFVPVGGKLFFSHYTDNGEYIEPDDWPQPWVTDGTAEGTRALSETGAFSFVPVGGDVLFSGRAEGTGVEPWTSDGTPAGTALVLDLAPGPSDGLMGLGTVGDLGLLWVRGMLWTSDGTSAGTRPLLRIRPESDLAPAPAFVPAGAITYFLVRWDGGNRLWRTDGTVAGTFALDPLLEGPLAFFYAVAVGDTLFTMFTEDAFHYALWKTDAAGTTLVPVRDGIDTQAVYPLPLAAAGRTLFFSAFDDGHGLELWKSDGAAEGTGLLRDIAPGVENSYPKALTEIDGVLLFAASDGVHGVELWRSDGTEGGTLLVQDVAPGSGSSNPAGFQVSGPRVFFSADDGVHGRELWAGWRGILTGQPRRALLDLREVLESLDLSHGAEVRLLSKVDGASAALERGDSASAARMLDTFTRTLSALRNMQIPAADADALADLATQTRSLLHSGGR